MLTARARDDNMLATVRSGAAGYTRKDAAVDRIGYCCFTPAATSVHTLNLRPLPSFERHNRIFALWIVRTQKTG